MRNRPVGIMFVAGAAAVVALAVALIARPPDIPHVVQSMGTPTPTTTPGSTYEPSADTVATLTTSYRSVLSAQDAIARTILDLPTEQHPRDAIARKLRETSFWNWRNQLTSASGMQVTAGGVHPDSVVWLVAVRVDGLSVEYFNVLPMDDLHSILNPNSPAAATAEKGSSSSRPLASAVYYVWNASAGSITTRGVLSDSNADGYESIEQLTDEVIVIPTPYLHMAEEPDDLPTVAPEYAVP